MREAQRCASVMRRYGLNYDQHSIEAGCYESTARELERQETTIAAQAAENKLLRKMLFYRVAGMSGYHDDGEMQDATEQPVIDFLRDSAADIELKLIARGMHKLAALQEATHADRKPD